jgi:hypothetical protein
MVPSDRDLRMSDADRERVLARLNVAVGEGRLTLSEFEERVTGVLNARTYGELEPFLAGLPMAPNDVQLVARSREIVELRNVASTLKRNGQWAVPRRLVVHSKAGSVRLDMRHAIISHQVIYIDLDVYAGSTTIVLPPGATADIDGVDMYAGSAKTKVPSVADLTGGHPHIIVSGNQRAGSLLVRYERQFLRWRW